MRRSEDGIELVRSSGFPDLDAAALKLMRQVKVNSPCAGQRVRWLVHFDYGPVDKTQTRDPVIERRIGNVMLLPGDPGADPN
jgi:hypothetical protein